MGKTQFMFPLMFVVLTSASIMAPVFATYTITLRLIVPTGKTLWTATLPFEVENATIYVPEPLYRIIVARYGKDTFTTPFNLTLLNPIGPSCILEITSEPSGWTITLKPMELPGDVNSDRRVNYKDLYALAASYGTSINRPENYNLFTDFNFDLKVDYLDLFKLATNYGAHA